MAGKHVEIWRENTQHQVRQQLPIILIIVIISCVILSQEKLLQQNNNNISKIKQGVRHFEHNVQHYFTIDKIHVLLSINLKHHSLLCTGKQRKQVEVAVKTTAALNNNSYIDVIRDAPYRPILNFIIDEYC